MYKKQFTSISFSSHKIKFVRLSSDRKKVQKFGSFDLPEKVIENGIVQNVDDLAKIIAKLWKQIGIRDKAVGLIIPEFSSFTKIVKLPSLPDKELDEAVRWQIREYLPRDNNEMVLDWKKISDDGIFCECLCIATPKSTLQGYVSAVSSSGLMPILVETPSICMSKICETDVGCLALYRSRGIALVTVFDGEKILSSTVLSISSDQVLVSSIYSIFNRFGSQIIKSLYVGGNGLNQQFVNELHTRLKLPTKLLNVAVSGITPSQVQTLIIPLAQQLSDPEEPESSKTINLLPLDWVMVYKKQLRDIRYWTITLIGSVVIWACFLIAFTTYVLMSDRASRLQSTVNQANQQSDAMVVTNINALNSKITKSEKLNSIIAISPYDIFNLLLSSVTNKGDIKAIEVQSDTKKISVEGIYRSRQEILNLKENLEKVDKFKNVSVPLEFLLSDKGGDYEINLDFTY